MDFYLDFEATRFSNRIISVGCSTTNGDTFFSLVKPPKGDKVDNFIAELTGITNEMLAEAPSADEVFASLFDFFLSHGDEKRPVYYVYGNCDIDFLKATINHMSDPKACMCVQAIMGGLVDYAPTVKHFFSASGDLALRKVYMLIKSYSELEQKHDALEDAIMLQTIVENLYDKCKPEDKALLMAMPSQKKPSLAGSGSTLPDYWFDWNGVSRANAKTGGTPDDWVIKGFDGEETIYFKDIEVAVLYIIKFKGKGLSPKKDAHKDRVRKAIYRNSEQKKNKAYGYFWTINYKEEGEK